MHAGAPSRRKQSCDCPVQPVGVDSKGEQTARARTTTGQRASTAHGVVARATAAQPEMKGRSVTVSACSHTVTPRSKRTAKRHPHATSHCPPGMACARATKSFHVTLIAYTNSAGVASLLGGIEPGTDVTASAVFDAGLAKVSLYFLIPVWPIGLTPCLFTSDRTPSRSPRWSERYDRPRRTSSASPRSRRGAGACRTSSTPPTASTSGRCGRCSRST